ncbi:MAG: phosphoribosylanthranilate isomerase [Oceanipulchritudo sp.]
MDLDHHTAFPRPLIQVAGVHDVAEARMLAEAGTDLIGIPLRLPVNKEDLGETAAAEISRAFPGRCCLITYLDKPDEIAALAGFLAVDWIQLHGTVDAGILPGLRRRLPRVRLVKSLVVGREPFARLEQSARIFSPHVNAFITDTFNPSNGAEGATGMVHDWGLSRRLRELADRPLILAGGLHAGNVAPAIRAVRPSGVDVHTGVEGPDGRKCPDKVRAFIAAAREAFREA